MRSHVSALEHLSKATKRTDDTLNHVESGLGALSKRVCQAVRIIGILSRHATVHPSHASHAAHAAHASIHATSVATIAAAVHGAHTPHGAEAGVR